MTKVIRWEGRIVIILLLFSFFVFSNQESNLIYNVNAASGSFSEDFTTTTYMDGANTNTSGWGTGSIENLKKKPSIVGSISSSLIGNTLDVFVDGNYAYVTNEEEGLKVVNITDPSTPNVVGTYDTADIAQSVYIDGDYAYITDYQGEVLQDKNFLVLNIADPTNPTHLGNCSTVFSAGDAARDVVVAGDTAYIANDQGGLSVIDISNPSDPSRIGVRDSAGTSSHLAIDGDYIFLADGTNGLVVIDITNPLTPTIVATFSTSISTASDIIVEGNYAYIVDINNGIVVVNITNPTSPTFAGSFSMSGTSGAHIYGNYLYVTDINDGLSVLKIAEPTTPILIDSISLPGNPFSITIDGNCAYIVCYNGGLQVIQIADFNAPTFSGWYDTPHTANRVMVAGDYAYVADRDSGLQVIDISDPTIPTSAGSYDTPGSAYEVVVAGDYAYVADYDQGLHVLDISDPTTPTLAGTYNTIGFSFDVYVTGDYAYVADYSQGLHVIDISNPTNPTLVETYNTLGNAFEVVVAGDHAYLADEGAGLKVFDTSDPTMLTLAGAYDTPGSAVDVEVAGDYAYIADWGSGLQVIDISDPTNPMLIGTYDTPDYAQGVAIAGDYAYISDGSSGLQVIDIRDPTNPISAGTYNTPGWSSGATIVGDYAYVADSGTGGLQVIEVQRTRSRQYDSPCYAQSSVISTGSGSYTILDAKLLATDSTPLDTSLSYSLSADSGVNWEPITPGLTHEFVHSGNQLKWRAILTTTNISITPKIYQILINYTTSLNAPTLDTPTEGYITEDYTPTFTWSTINGESNYLFQLDTTTSFITLLLNTTLPISSTSFTPSSPLALDTYYWRVAGIDSEGDVGAFSNYRSIAIIQDNSVPTIDHPSDVPYQLGQTGNTITWNPTDSNPYWYNITLNSFLIEDDTWDGGSITFNVDGLPEGTHTVICAVFDLDGNNESDIVDVIVSSTNPPVIDDVADFEYEEGDTGNSITWHPTDTNPDYYSVTRDGSIVDDGTWLGGDINIDIDGLAYGVYTYVCTVNDTEGQEVSDSVVVTVTDTVSPLINSPADVIYDEGDTGNSILWVATDTNPASYIVYREGVQIETNSWSSGDSIVISVDGLSPASYNYTIVVFDEAGNSAKDEVTVAVTPTVPEFNQSIFFTVIIITAMLTLCYKKRRKYNKE